MMLIIMMLLGTEQLEQVEANFAICFSECFLPCIIDLDKEYLVDRSKILPCLGKCSKHCLFRVTPVISSHSPQQYYCNIGCAIANCPDLDAQKMDLCNDNCSKNICKFSG
ncbi:hypothetical protein M5689_021599 [Euphorbia peplus]|nr:hypothetical protein M5689_021599 [Euphorbia peplus]